MASTVSRPPAEGPPWLLNSPATVRASFISAGGGEATGPGLVQESGRLVHRAGRIHRTALRRGPDGERGETDAEISSEGRGNLLRGPGPGELRGPLSFPRQGLRRHGHQATG